MTLPMPSAFIRFLKPRAGMAKWLLTLALAIFLALGYFGYHAQIKALLDQSAYATRIGGVRISPYVFIKAVLTIVILFWAAGTLNEFFEAQILRIRGIRSATRTLIAKFFQIFFYVVCGLLSLRALGIDLTALAVLGGAVGIGLGFGLQKIASNYISGFILLFERTLEVGDLIQLVDGTEGYVRYMGARHTLIEAFDGKEIMIPNEDFITNRMINLTHKDKKARIDIAVRVSYRADFNLVQRLLLDAAEEHPRAMKDPAPSCFLNDFGDGGALFVLQFWVGDVTEGRYSPKSDVMFTLWRKFREHGIELAMSQQEVIYTPTNTSIQ